MLFLTAGEMRKRRGVFTGGGFASNSDPRPHFGVGSAEKVDSLEVRWPGGARQIPTDLPVNRIIEIEEGNPNYRVLPASAGAFR